MHLELALDLDLKALRARLPSRPLTRFAPSPTGYLHLGHVVNALYTWRVARALGGRVLVRVEDHDRLRSRPEYERALLEDLAWLGFEPDAGPVRQSDEPEAYSGALARLAASHHVYACDCSRREIAATSGAGERGSEELRYLGRCRTRRIEIAPGRGIRVAIEPGVERFEDARLGAQEQAPAVQCGDLLVCDRDGFWTYQFAVTVDDCRHGVDLVIRGEDLLSSTGRQIRLARMLGRERPPVFLHHRLLRRPDGEKLSKSSGDTGVRELRAAGLGAEDVIALALEIQKAQLKFRKS
ncbi:MAG: glutamate--tRNA ligase family protein [Vicinamibacterales bacterium]